VNWSSQVPTIPKLWFRAAEPEEIDWFKGEWDRLILKAVERDFPTQLPIYRVQALKVLNRAVDRGERSARMLGSLGLLRIEMGDDMAAMSALEEAVAAGSDRPLVFVELARLRLAHYLESEPESNPKLTESEATQVLSLVREALKYRPKVQGASTVARAVFEHLNRNPTPEESHLLDAGL
jgi:hypothetical protein